MIQYEEIEGGGVTSAKGFKACGIHAGFRANPERLDMALVVADQPSASAATFTQNVFCAAPVQFSKEQLRRQGLDDAACGMSRAVVINSGNANAATGAEGLRTAEQEAELVADAIGCPLDEVLVASTGVIGVQLPLEPFIGAMPLAAQELSDQGGHDAAKAIMTTDTFPKEFAARFAGDSIGYPGCTFTVGGMAKGSGMIMPNMATMISVLTTDAPILPADLHVALSKAVSKSFNKVTVDSDTSTNDTCIILSSGAAARDPFDRSSEAFSAFEEALCLVCEKLARMMAKDGEGATRLITVTVSGAASEKDADLAARAIANSPLVKTAIAGRDANWGRIAAAIGKSGAKFNQQDTNIAIMGMKVCEDGLAIPFDEEEALERFESPEIAIDVDLGAGECQTIIWTCDLTHEYIHINAAYRT